MTADGAGGAPSHPASITVELGERSYAILIGDALLGQAGALIRRHAPANRVLAVSDETVAQLHGDRLLASLRAAGFEPAAVTVPAGEASKSFAMLEQVVGEILSAGIERGDLVIAFGGGVVGDLAGFAAAIARRGVRLVQIPTTLLAQVDSSVGGKTGINTGHGKNLVGAFHQPSLVIADTAVLATLPQREMRAGYAEVAKYGLLGDAGFFAWLEEHGASVLAGDGEAIAHAVRVSCQAKAAIVAADEREAGQRALLNLGHTFGHALEAATGYGGHLLHGEGVAIGMSLAFALSVELGLCPDEDARRMRRHLAGLGLPVSLGEVAGDLPDADGLIALMAQDKKVRDGQLTFILARGIGGAFITRDVAQDVVRGFLARQLAAR